MNRTPSLPELDQNDRGKGLAEIKGRDPMDRRIELEKKARYAQALREQIDANSTGKNTPRESELGSPSTPSWQRRTGSANRTGVDFGPGSASRGGVDFGRRGEFGETFRDFAVGGASPAAAEHSAHQSDSFKQSRSSSGGPGGRSSPPSGGLGGRTSPHTVQSAQEYNEVTAEKVGRVQEIMRLRLNSLQEEQQRQWQRVQAAMQDQVHSVNECAEQAVARQLAQFRDAHVGDIRTAADGVQAMRRECELQGRRTEALTEEIGALRNAVARLEADGQAHGSRLQEHGEDIEKLKNMHRECQKFREEMRREQRVQDEAITKLSTELGNLIRKVNEVAECANEVERLKAAHKDLLRQIADCQRAQASAEREAADNAARLRADCAELAKRVGDQESGMRRLREELPRIASRAAQEALDNVRLPDPAPRAPTPPRVNFVVSEEAFAVLRNGDEEQYELPALQNVVGRSPTCNAVISGSQAISNRHASIHFDVAGNADLKDLGSRNGTFLNERRVPQEAGFRLQSGDSVQLGIDGPTYIFEYGPAYYARWPRNMERIIEGGRERRDSTPSRGRMPSPTTRSSWRP